MGPRPLCGASWSAYSPEASESQASVWPSGDQAGSRSAAPGVRERLRASPFSAGTVKTSPRVEKAARAPVGEIAAPCTPSPASTKRGRIPSRSEATVILGQASAPVASS